MSCNHLPRAASARLAGLLQRLGYLTSAELLCSLLHASSASDLSPLPKFSLQLSSLFTRYVTGFKRSCGILRCIKRRQEGMLRDLSADITEAKLRNLTHLRRELEWCFAARPRHMLRGGRLAGQRQILILALCLGAQDKVDLKYALLR